jgi:peptide/nickel transport system permease protein
MTVDNVSETQARTRWTPATDAVLAPPKDAAFPRWLWGQVCARPFYAGIAALLILIVSVAAFAPVLPVADPDAQSLVDRMQGPLTRDSQGDFHIAGTDQLGRDVFSRVVYGARISLFIAFAAVLCSGVAGTLAGLFSGYRGGLVDLAFMRLVDLQMAFPALLFTIFLLYVIGSSMLNLVVLLAVLGWVSYARIVRAQTLSLRNQPFVEGAVAIGCTDSRILLRHILPQLVPVLATVAVLDFVSVILAEASLSFLGLGIQPPTSSLGRMVADGQEHLFTGGWWLFVIPGLVIFLIVLCANLTSRWIQYIVDRSPIASRTRSTR